MKTLQITEANARQFNPDDYECLAGVCPDLSDEEHCENCSLKRLKPMTEEKAFRDKIDRVELEELMYDEFYELIAEAIKIGKAKGHKEAMRWRDTKEELPEFNKNDYPNGDYKRYLIKVVRGSISTRSYVAVGWLISANRWNVEMDWVNVIGWRPIE